jgi:L-idonate 5-dehydrogenase
MSELGRPMRLRCLCLVIHAANDLRVDEQEITELIAGQVLVKVGFGGICGSDLHYFKHGGFGAIRLKQPMILGHEVAGTVMAVAADVTQVKIGDKVAVNPSQPCGVCLYCREGLPNHCLDMRFYGSAMRMPHVQGAFRNALVCNANQCHWIKPELSLQIAALAEPFSVGLHGVSRAGSLLGKRVLVSGCGPIGVLAVAAAKLHGAAEIVATDVVDQPLDIAKKMGAHIGINAATNKTWIDHYSQNKGSFDVMLECSGNEQALRDGLQVMRPRGTVVQLGLGGDVSIPQNMVVGKELSICGSFRFHAEFALAAQILNEERMDFSPMITHSFAVSEAGPAFAMASDRALAMKVQIDFND